MTQKTLTSSQSEKKPKVKQIYWNSKQLEFLAAPQKLKAFLGGRGTGKTTTEGGEQYQILTAMPRSKGFLSSTTYNQLLTKTLPAMEAKWNEIGLLEDEDYVVGRRPPKTWKKPLQPPRKFENIVSFSNGRCIELLSMDRPDLARGGSYTDGAVDECALVPWEHIARVLLPSLRGYLHQFDTCRFYQSLRLYTSIPWKPSGYWIFDFEQKAKANPKQYKFVESTTWDNVDVLGEDYIRMLERELPYLEYLVEVMNQRVRKTNDAFYHRFNPDYHTYAVSYLYGEGERGIITTGTADPHYKPDQLLDITFDFSGWFNCCTTWQEGKQDKRAAEYCLHQFFVKHDEGKVHELVEKVCAHYKDHRYKMVRLWGEPRGHDRRADSIDTIYDTIVRTFKTNGWKAEVRVPAGQVRKHKERAEYMNMLLAEDNTALPLLRMNDATCKDAIIAMQVTEVTADFQKNKTKEKDRMFPQEHAPHFTDGIDYYFTQKYGHRVRRGGMRPAMTATMR
jgi:hypothetical protein